MLSTPNLESIGIHLLQAATINTTRGILCSSPCT